MSCQRGVVLEAVVLQNSVQIIARSLKKRGTETFNITDAIFVEFRPHLHDLADNRLVGQPFPVAFWGSMCEGVDRNFMSPDVQVLGEFIVIVGVRNEKG